MSTSFRNEINKKSFLIDVSTFSFVNFNTVGDEIFANKAVEDYKESIKYIQKFNNAYILVDYIFMNNFQEIEKENNLLILNIYMFEGNYFIMNLYKDKDKIMDEIKIFKNKCKNPMLDDESDYLSKTELEEFIRNYFDLLSQKNFFQKSDNEPKEVAYLFDFKSRINYVLDMYKIIENEDKNIEIIEKPQLKFYVEILSTKHEYNGYYDYDKLYENLMDKKDKFKNFVFVRKTEFANRFSNDVIKSIIQYLFGSNDVLVIDNMFEYKDKISIHPSQKYEKYNCVELVKYNSSLPFLFEDNKSITPKELPLIEYIYFLSSPLLLPKMSIIPNVLIFGEDFGLLSFYFNAYYKTIFKITSFMEHEEILINKQEIFKIDNSNIKVMNFNEVISRYKNKKTEIIKFDIILVEYFGKKNANDTTIPNLEILNKMEDIINILNSNGILCFNLRAESFKEINDILNKLKAKCSNCKIIEIELRVCSSIIFICKNMNVKLEDYYHSFENIFVPIIKNEIEDKINI